MPAEQRFDTVVLGAGPGGEVAVNTLVAAGQRVAMVERELVGGECTNWGCVPSKTLLRASELIGSARRVAGVSEPAVDFDALAAYRDWMVSDHNDAKRVASYEKRGVTVIKGDGRLDGPGRVIVGDQHLLADAVVVATGAEAAIPPIPGLEEAGYWTNREATAASRLPESLVFVGGGPTAVELGQFFARLGSRVAIVQGPDRLLNREDPRIGELLAELLRSDGIELQLGRRAVGVRVESGERVVELDDGTVVRGQELVLAAGRRPRVDGIGLETVGTEVTRRGITVDERCQAAEGVWAIGDVTGVAPFTHVAKYQGRIAARAILGHEARADYRSVPRVIFTDPEVAAVGLSEEAARAAGLDVEQHEIELANRISRPYTYEQEPTGRFAVLVDRRAGTLAGAWAVAPLASEWIHQLALAIRAEVPLEVLEDTIAQFPSFSEAIGVALRALPTASG